MFIQPTMPSNCQDNGAFMDGPRKEVSNQKKLKHFSGTKKLAIKLVGKAYSTIHYLARGQNSIYHTWYQRYTHNWYFTSSIPNVCIFYPFSLCLVITNKNHGQPFGQYAETLQPLLTGDSYHSKEVPLKKGYGSTGSWHIDCFKREA